MAFVVVGAGLASAGSASAAVTKTFSSNGQPSQSFVVPDGVTAVQITVEGASGGAGWHGGSTGGAGGVGSQIAGTLVVSPGEQFLMEIGGPGGDASASGGVCFFNSPGDRSQGGGGGGLGVTDWYGGNGGVGDLCLGGAGGGGGSATFVEWLQDFPEQMITAGGGGGGGGGGGIGGYGGGSGGSGGSGNGHGSNGSGAGSGNGGQAAWSPDPAGIDASGACMSSSAGGGGGGGAGDSGGLRGGNGCSGGGGGGGGGAGSDQISPDLSQLAVSTAPAGSGSVAYTYTLPASRRTACIARGGTRHPRKRVVGTARRDRLRGTAGADVIVGGPGRDRIRARGGADLICAGGGNDRISGGKGADVVVGGAGRDRITTGGGRDRVVTGAGRDRIRSRGGGRDVIDCGRGKDLAVVDGKDRTRRCEKVVRRS